MDSAGLSRVLLVSLPGAGGIRSHGGELQLARPSDSFILSPGHGGEPVRNGKSAADQTLSRVGRDFGGNQPQVTAGAGGGAAFGAAGGAGADVRRTGARNPQSPGGDQGIGGEDGPRGGGNASNGPGAGGVYIQREKTTLSRG